MKGKRSSCIDKAASTGDLGSERVKDFEFVVHATERRCCTKCWDLIDQWIVSKSVFLILRSWCRERVGNWTSWQYLNQKRIWTDNQIGRVVFKEYWVWDIVHTYMALNIRLQGRKLVRQASSSIVLKYEWIKRCLISIIEVEIYLERATVYPSVWCH